MTLASPVPPVTLMFYIHAYSVLDGQNVRVLWLGAEEFAYRHYALSLIVVFWLPIATLLR